jgi:dTDP-4-amino-4,6-dideoxygalactose transaminase
VGREPAHFQAHLQVPVRIPVFRPRLPPFEELEPYLRRIDAARTYSNHGPLVSEFESRLADRLRVSYAVVSASSGTTALIAAILAVAGRAGPKRPLALVPAYTFVATALAVEACGYRPVLCDVDPADWMLSPAAVRAYPRLGRVGLVVVVAPYGRPFRQDAWLAVQDECDVPVAIDAAAAFDVLADSPEASAGAFGPIPVALSFHATKSFGIGEGGAIVTTSPRVGIDATQSLNLGFFGSRDCATASFNGKLSEYHAAVGLAGLDRWDASNEAFVVAAQRYRAAAERHGIERLFETKPSISGCYVLLRTPSARAAQRVASRLGERGIGTRFWYGGGIQGHRHFAGSEHDGLPVTQRIATSLVGLPVAPDLCAEHIEEIVRLAAAALD